MTEYVLRTRDLTKRYGKKLALDNVSMEIRRGAIYGFIGRNGAGKTTLMKVVCNLADSTSGGIELFGDSTSFGIAAGRKRIGSLIEVPSLYSNLTAVGNMEVQARTNGMKDHTPIMETLELVDLQNVAHKKVKSFSLGMKQRLGMALALLSQPDFLVLDEPINGLDPIGIAEIRETLQKLATERNIAILISSHILTELHHLATDYGFIENGKLLKQLTAEELVNECRQYINLQTGDSVATVQVLQNELGISDFEVLPDGTIRIYERTESTEEISLALGTKRIGIRNLSVQGQDLEDYFISLTGGAAR